MQYLTVFAMSASGAALGAVYDIYRTILAEWKYLRFLSSILDFVYWVFALLLVLWSLYSANNGDVRFYVFLLLGIGLVLYRLLLRKIVVGSTVRMVLAITYAFQVLYRLFWLLVITPLLGCLRLTLALARLIDRLAAMLERVILWPFGPLLSVIEWLGRNLYRWTIVPLIDPVLRPVKRHVIDPVRQFFVRAERKWKGFLRSVANWLINSDDEDDEKPKR
jgi:spore cortex biosynthesis protein YabQ